MLPPPPPLATKLPTLALPDTLRVPSILAPVPVTTNTFALPALLIVILPLFITLILLVPFVRPDVLIVTNDRLPAPSVDITCPPVPPLTYTLPIAPKLLVPLTLSVPALTLPVVVTLPPVILPVAVTNPPVPILPIFALPVILTTLLTLSKVNAVLEFALPASLNTTLVLEPGITTLPEMLPEMLPMKFAAVILPVALKLPLPSLLYVTFAVALPTTNPVNVPTLVILGWALVVNVPVSNNAPIVPAFAYILAVVVMFPDAVNIPVDTLPAVKLPVAVIVLLDEIELLATNALAVTVPEKLAFVIPVILAGKSIVSD